MVPSDKETNVDTTVALLAEFNKPVTGVSASTFTLTLRDSASPVSAVVAYDPVTRRASLGPEMPLYPSKAYDAMLSGDIIDGHGNQLTGITSWSFLTAADATPPTVIGTSPPSGAAGVSVDAVLVATFSEPTSHVSTTSFVLKNAAGPVPGGLSYVSLTAVSFTPSIQLAPYTTYEATLTSEITDVGGNQLANSPVTWTFMTGADTVAPVLVARNPLEDDTDVSRNVVVTARFSEPVVGVSTTSMLLEQGASPVAAAVTYISTTRTARLVPDAPLLPNTTYAVILNSAITDASGNAISAAPVTWFFTTGP